MDLCGPMDHLTHRRQTAPAIAAACILLLHKDLLVLPNVSPLTAKPPQRVFNLYREGFFPEKRVCEFQPEYLYYGRRLCTDQAKRLRSIPSSSDLRRGVRDIVRSIPERRRGSRPGTVPAHVAGAVTAVAGNACVARK